MRYWLFIFAAFACVITSCNETVPVGSTILPPGNDPDNRFSDTTTIHSFTVSDDSLRSDRLFLSQLGYTEDPVFGTTKASMLSSFSVPTLPLSSAVSDTIGGYFLDSVILSLVINDLYGDTTAPMNFTVYKLPTLFNTDEIFYSNQNLPQGMVEVGRVENFTPSRAELYDEDTVLTDLKAQLRIKLNPFFGQSLINVLKSDISRNNDLFRTFLPGLVIVPDEDPGSIIEVDVLTTSTPDNISIALEDSRIHLYVKNSLDSNLIAIYPATILNLGINKYEHDFQSTNVETALLSNNPDGDAVNYIQGLAGVKTRVEFPYLSSYGEQAAIIKAELVITQIPDGDEDVFTPPERLFLLKTSADSLVENISDLTNFPPAHYDGFGETVTLDNGMEVFQYRINISDHLQSILDGTESGDGMFITVYGAQDLSLVNLNASDLIPDRIVIGGGTNTNDGYQMRLDLTYTVLD